MLVGQAIQSLFKSANIPPMLPSHSECLPWVKRRHKRTPATCRLTPESGHHRERLERPLCAKGAIIAVPQIAAFSITSWAQCEQRLIRKLKLG
jgi:hypothetical protein